NRSGQRRRPSAASKGRARRPSGSPSRRRRAAPAAPAAQRALQDLRRWTTSGPLGWVTSTTGVRAWAFVSTAVVWLVMVALWVTGTTKGSFALFVATLLTAALATAWLAARTGRAKEPLRAARAAVVVGMAAAVPVVFDPHSGDVFNLPKFTVVVVGAVVLAGLWAVSAVHRREIPRWQTGLQWVVGAVVLWTAVCAVFSVDVHISLLGNYGSYDGLYSAAAYGVTAMTAAEALEVADVRRVLTALAFCGGTVVVFYGLVQLHDSEATTRPWDFIVWHLGSFDTTIFSTFGNPNHLGGYLAMLLPAVLVLGIGAERWAWKIAGGLFTLAVLVELLRTSARGAWVAAVLALAVLAVGLAPELKRQLALSAVSATAVVVVAAAGMAADGKRFLAHPLYQLFQTGGNTPAEQRLMIWKSAVHMAADHPLVGVGPDAFALMYPQYESATWVKDFGSTYLVNGAHDIFMNLLADQGFIGLVLFLGLLGLLGLVAVGAWRRARVVERGESVTAGALDGAHEVRSLVAVVSASITAYVVQAVFNVQQVGLSFVFWLLVGLLGALAVAAGVPGTLRPATLLSPLAGRDEADGDAARDPAPPRRPAVDARWQRRRARELPWPTAVAAVVVTALVVLAAVEADRPWRADHDYWAAALLARPNPSPNGLTLLVPAYFTLIQEATSLNPAEPTYPAYEATTYGNAADRASDKSEGISDLELSRSLLAKAVADEPLWGPYPASEADVYLALAGVQPTGARQDVAAAAPLARLALKDDPRDSAYQSLVSKIESIYANKPASSR
ncbi:MAG TPA: O-antigen ligase family protein, partial [Acidimicrobiales bacterium]|nr:O-antigen ligase family protein [Acidimicrobiales bacterium]